MTRAEQDQHVAEFMRRMGFKWFENGWCWARLDNPEDEVSPETSFTRKQATFMWRTAVEAQRDEIKAQIELGDSFGWAYTRSHLEDRLVELDRLLETEGE